MCVERLVGFARQLPSTLPHDHEECERHREQHDADGRPENDSGCRQHRTSLEPRFDDEGVGVEVLGDGALPTNNVAALDVRGRVMVVDGAREVKAQCESGVRRNSIGNVSLRSRQGEIQLELAVVGDVETALALGERGVSA